MVMDYLMPRFLSKTVTTSDTEKWKHFDVLKLAGESLSEVIKKLNSDQIVQLNQLISVKFEKGTRLAEEIAEKAVSISLRSFDVGKDVAEVLQT